MLRIPYECGQANTSSGSSWTFGLKQQKGLDVDLEAQAKNISTKDYRLHTALASELNSLEILVSLQPTSSTPCLVFGVLPKLSKPLSVANLSEDSRL